MMNAEEARSVAVQTRLNEAEVASLNTLTEILGVSRGAVLRMGLNALFRAGMAQHLLDGAKEVLSEPPHRLGAQADTPVVRDVKENYEKAVAALEAKEKSLKLNDTAHRHVHKPGVVLDEFWEQGTRYRTYACAGPDCDTIMKRRH